MLAPLRQRRFTTGGEIQTAAGTAVTTASPAPVGNPAADNRILS